MHDETYISEYFFKFTLGFICETKLTKLKIYVLKLNSSNKLEVLS